jgi:dienelactone hydrolase
MRLIIAAITATACLTGQERPREIQDRNEAYGNDLELHLRKYIVDDYAERAKRAWNRSYKSVEAFNKSVEPNRKRYREFLKPPQLKRTGAVERRPHSYVSDIAAEWISIPLGRIRAEGVLAIPASASPSKPVPLVIAQHGIGSTPEIVFGLHNPTGTYKDYGHALVREGFAVLAPFNLATVEKRNRIERLARLAGTTLPGIEFVRMQALLDAALEDKRIDAKRVGMWGISLGGMATMFWMPLEPRIQCGVVCAWFNHRRNKMAVPDPRYSCFLETREEHAFFDGWLSEFTDSDVISLMCPRPVLVQHGKADRIAHWPQVVEEFEVAKTHYQRLGIADRIEIDVHEGGHEIRLETGIPFLRRWLGVERSR